MIAVNGAGGETGVICPGSDGWLGQPDAVEKLTQTLEEEVNEPQGGDLYFGACAGAIQRLVSSGEMVGLVQQAMELRLTTNHKPIPPEYLRDLLIKMVNKQVVRYDSNFPNSEYLDPETYVRRIQETILDSPIACAEFVYDGRRNNMANKIGRYAVNKLLMSSEKDRWGAQIRWLDIGTSGMYGPTHIATNSLFDEIEFGDLESEADSHGHRLFVPNAEISASLNQALAEEVTLADSFGVDPVPLYDRGNWEWVEVCSYRPGEMAKKPKMTYEQFRNMPRPGLDFLLGELTLEGVRDLMADELWQGAPSEGFDLITLNTVLYQQHSDVKQGFVDALRPYLSDNGIIAVQDFCYRQKGGLEFYRRRDPFTYTTHVFGLEDGNFTPLEVFRGYNGRDEQIARGRDFQQLVLSEKLEAA